MKHNIDHLRVSKASPYNSHACCLHLPQPLFPDGLPPYYYDSMQEADVHISGKQMVEIISPGLI